MPINKNTPNSLRQGAKSFTTNLNDTLNLIKDPAALGIYVYLSSKPDKWEIQETELMRHFESGRDFIRKRIKILKEIGLLSKSSVRNSKGHISYWETRLYCCPNDNPFLTHSDANHITENPTVGPTGDRKTPPPINKRDLQIKEDYTHTENECSDLEQVLFPESAKRNIALTLKSKCLKNSKCKARYTELPSQTKKDKSYLDLLNECILHYGTRKEPTMVGPERFLTWITTEIHYQEKQNNKNSQGYSNRGISRWKGAEADSRPQPPLFDREIDCSREAERETRVHPLLKEYIETNHVS